MCLFVSIALPAGADLGAVREVLRRHGRAFRSNATPEAVPFLRPGDRYGTIERNRCDCGTILGSRWRARDDAERPVTTARHLSKLRRRGWSKSRVQRWADARAANAEWNQSHRDQVHAEQETPWDSLLRELLRAAGASGLRLLLHEYTGTRDESPLPPYRGQVLTAEELTPETLRAIREDEVYEIRA